ncbi:MAG: RadC family protein [Catonella sp.]
METTRIEDLPKDTRPFEKYQKQGIGMLSDVELLALILRTGTKKINCMELCRRVLAVGGGSLAGLYGKTEAELQKISGIGPVKAAEIICICELARRIARARHSYDEPLDTAAKIAEKYMEEMRHFKEEHVLLLLLDIKCRLIKELTISIGTINQSFLRPREVFVQVLKYEAVNFILLHNHPSGDPSPSKSDMIITDKIIEVARLIGIPLVDHIIIGDCCYISFREKGLAEFETKK